MPITLTEKATDRLRSLLAAEDAAGMALRVGVRSGGCSGFLYDLHFDADVASDDVETEFDGVRVIVDAGSAVLLERSTLDYRDSLTEQGFRIENPNAQRSCGCGKSFC